VGRAATVPGWGQAKTCEFQFMGKYGWKTAKHHAWGTEPQIGWVSGGRRMKPRPEEPPQREASLKTKGCGSKSPHDRQKREARSYRGQPERKLHSITCRTRGRGWARETKFGRGCRSKKKKRGGPKGRKSTDRAKRTRAQWTEKTSRKEAARNQGASTPDRREKRG